MEDGASDDGFGVTGVDEEGVLTDNAIKAAARVDSNAMGVIIFAVV